MRNVNPETGKPYPRVRPMRMAEAFRIVRHRKAHDAIIAQGFVELLEHSAFPAAIRIGGSGKYTEVCLHPDGSRIYAKPVGRNVLERTHADEAQDRAFREYHRLDDYGRRW